VPGRRPLDTPQSQEVSCAPGQYDEGLGGKGPGPVPGFGRLTVVDEFGGVNELADRTAGSMDAATRAAVGQSRESRLRGAPRMYLRCEQGGKSGIGVATHLVTPRARVNALRRFGDHNTNERKAP